MNNGKLIVIENQHDVDNLRRLNKRFSRPAVRRLVVTPERDGNQRGRPLSEKGASQNIARLFNEGGNRVVPPVFSLVLLLFVLLQLESGAGLSFSDTVLSIAFAVVAAFLAKCLLSLVNHYRLEQELSALETTLSGAHY
ncbi:hypothetical protein WKI13_08480 [Teredinibacter turnerae]|uniref:hypothetical protein n=1 Tax=Teredinibacter turnerae TaxID=2426 RepID=UPI0003818129|nr:hypothetical protein [Teredinibacter turnerae]